MSPPDHPDGDGAALRYRYFEGNSARSTRTAWLPNVSGIAFPLAHLLSEPMCFAFQSCRVPLGSTPAMALTRLHGFLPVNADASPVRVDSNGPMRKEGLNQLYRLRRRCRPIALIYAFVPVSLPLTRRPASLRFRCPPTAIGCGTQWQKSFSIKMRKPLIYNVGQSQLFCGLTPFLLFPCCFELHAAANGHDACQCGRQGRFDRLFL
jgi:hypothetical protein